MIFNVLRQIKVYTPNKKIIVDLQVQSNFEKHLDVFLSFLTSFSN